MTTEQTTIAVLPASPELAKAREEWEDPFKPVPSLQFKLPGPDLARMILEAPLRTAVGPGKYQPSLIIARRSWSKEAAGRADAAAEPGSPEWTAELGTPEEAVLTEDGGGERASEWCRDGDGDDWVFYERWSADGREAHGWLCQDCRRLVQSG